MVRVTDQHCFLLHLHLQHIEFADAAIQDIDRNVTALITLMDQEVEAGQTRGHLSKPDSTSNDDPSPKPHSCIEGRPSAREELPSRKT